MKILCQLGFHKFVYQKLIEDEDSFIVQDIIFIEKCRKCRKERNIVYLIWNGDKFCSPEDF